MSWRQQVPACFGSVSDSLADREADVERIQQLLSEARTAGVDKDAIGQEIRAYLHQARVDPSNRERLLDDAETLLDGLWDRIEE